MSTTRFPGFDSPAVGFEQPFEMLHACHERVQRSLALLQRLLDHVATQGHDAASRSAAADVLRYFDLAAPLHHADEEQDVFPALAGVADVALQADVAQLCREHVELAARWQSLRPILAALARADSSGPLHGDVQAQVQAFAASYERHITLEEQRVYPAARARLAQAEQDAAGARMAARRRVAPVPDPVPGAAAAPAPDWVEWIHELIHLRQTTLPKRLGDPGPDAMQLDLILRAASAAPDHKRLRPWRLVLVPTDQRDALAQVFGAALLERDPDAAPDQVAQAREKAYRAPVLLLAVVQLEGLDPEVSAAERLVSLGCAVQNMLLLATAQGFGSAITSGKALGSGKLRELFSLQKGEQAVCFVSVGRALRSSARAPRAEPGAYVSTLGQP